jgi:hypothetical protein
MAMPCLARVTDVDEGQIIYCRLLITDCNQIIDQVGGSTMRTMQELRIDIRDKLPEL